MVASLVYSMWLPPIVLTILAWRAGVQTIAAAANLKARTRARTWPAMLFLAVPVIVVVVFVCLRLGRANAVFAAHVFGWMLAIGTAFSVVAFVASIWSSPGFRPLGLCAAAVWLLCFGLVVQWISGLAGLR